eukprot:1160056-Pelagomonas_calceolata.AAC.8
MHARTGQGQHEQCTCLHTWTLAQVKGSIGNEAAGHANTLAALKAEITASVNAATSGVRAELGQEVRRAPSCHLCTLLCSAFFLSFMAKIFTYMKSDA